MPPAACAATAGLGAQTQSSLSPEHQNSPRNETLVGLREASARPTRQVVAGVCSYALLTLALGLVLRPGAGL